LDKLIVSGGFKATETGRKREPWNDAAGFADIEAFIAAHSKDPLMSGKVFGTRDFLNERAAALQVGGLDILRSAAAHMGLYGNSAGERAEVSLSLGVTVHAAN
jgi:hypothetical protein